MQLNWAQNFVTNLHRASLAAGFHDHYYRAAHAQRPTPARKRKHDGSDLTLFARPGHLNVRRVTGGIG